MSGNFFHRPPNDRRHGMLELVIVNLSTIKIFQSSLAVTDVKLDWWWGPYLSKVKYLFLLDGVYVYRTPQFYCYKFNCQWKFFQYLPEHYPILIVTIKFIICSNQILNDTNQGWFSWIIDDKLILIFKPQISISDLYIMVVILPSSLAWRGCINYYNKLN